MSFKKFLFSNLMLLWQPKKKWPLVIKHTNWVDNHLMIITAKYGLHHFSDYGENAVEPFSHYKSMGAFCCHGNQTKSKITIILAVLKAPKQATFLPSLIRTILAILTYRSLQCFLQSFESIGLLVQEEAKIAMAAILDFQLE